MHLQPGQIIGDYEVAGALGAGGMGSVYRVRNLLSDRVDAMKVLLPDLRNSTDLADRFLQEIKVLASLSHPNIASLYTAMRIDNQLLMIMEFVEGQNLDERLKAGPLAPGDGVACIGQVLSALAYAHRHGVIHRDVKPANIATRADGTVKLLDFGLARAERDRRLTLTGMVLGSLYYMAPEQVNGKPADARSDLYSTGITLYRMLTGKRPIEGGSEFEVMQAQVAKTPPPPSRVNPAIPEELSCIIMRAIEKAPEDRFQSAEDFQSALGVFLPLPSSLPPGTRAVPRATPIGAGQFGSGMTGSTPIPSSNRFHAAALEELRKGLAISMGPIAGALVKKYSQMAEDLPQLCGLLAEQIQAEADRRAFLNYCRTGLKTDIAGVAVKTPTPTPAPAAGQDRPPVWDSQMLEKSRRDLAGYIGPLARVIVDRAAKRARSVPEFYSLISAEIPSEKDRARFLASR